ncbi:MAG: hypothetical protein L0Y35_02645 [Flammeovirgaceae bacterium]|nr:hypothetical protein [Flammeovirgaceae bacterium]
MRPFIKWLGIKPDGQEHRDEQVARMRIASSVIERIEEEFSLSLSEEVLNQIKTKSAYALIACAFPKQKSLSW